MNRKVQIWGLGLALLLSGGAMMPKSATAQDADAHRKIRSKVVPEYPDLAKRINLTGKVKIEATISADGRVTTTTTIGGSPVLASAAVDALKKWRFEPASKDTTEIFEFEFSGQS